MQSMKRSCLRKGDAMKRIINTNIGITLLVIAIIFVWLFPTQESQSVGFFEKNQIQTLRIGITMYQMKDTFIYGLAQELEKQIHDLEREMGIRIVYEIHDAQENQTIQNEQIQYFVEQKYDILIVNLVNPPEASQIVNKAKKNQIPVIFFNRQPVKEDIYLWDQVYYVGVDGEETGRLQAQILSDSSYDVDRNHDGILEYILVEGEEAHQDSILRTDAFLKAIEQRFSPKQLTRITTNWLRKPAEEAMRKLPQEQIEQTEAIICNNDDMALGVIDYLTDRLPKEKWPFIVGVNGSMEFLQLMKEGNALGTVSLESQEQAAEIVRLIRKIGLHQEDLLEQRIYLTPQKIQM